MDVERSKNTIETIRVELSAGEIEVILERYIRGDQRFSNDFRFIQINGAVDLEFTFEKEYTE